MKTKLQKYFRPISLSTASILLVLASFLSYVAGFLRDLILSYYFGAGSLTDVYSTAFLIPDILFNFTVAAALAGAFMPIFRGVYLKDKNEAADLAGAFLWSSQIFMLVVAGICFISMPWLVPVLFGNASLTEQSLIIDLSRIMLLSPIVFSVSNTLGSVLMSFKHYLSYALSAALYNFGIILGVLMFHTEYGIYSAAFGVVIGLVFHLGVRLIDMYSVDFRLNMKLWSPHIWDIVKLSLPRSFGLISMQLSLLCFTIVGYSLVDGSIAAFNLARNVQSFAVSLFGIAVATAVFPFLVDHNEKSESEELLTKVNFSLLQICLYTIPATAGLALLANPIINFLFERGAFDSAATMLTASILFYFAFSVPFESAVHLLSRVFYVFKHTWTLVVINLVFLAVNLVTGFLIAKEYGAWVFGLSFAVGNFIQVVLMWFALKRFVMLRFSLILKDLLKVVLSTGGMGLAVYGFNYYQFNLLGTILVGVLIYLLLITKFGILKYAGLERFKFISKLIK